MNDRVLRLQIPEKLMPLLTEPKRLKIAYGGRGGGKSWAFADGLIARAIQQTCRVLCTREIQNTIKDSVHRLLSDRIQHLGVEDLFEITDKEIRCHNGSLFLFKGLRTNTTEIKSLEGINYCWVEEAALVSEESWGLLIPTIRQEGSEIWVSFNTGAESDPVYERFVKNPRSDSIVVLINYPDNPWFPDVLRAEMEHDKSSNYERYLHVWEGKPGGQGRFFGEFGSHLREMPFHIQPHTANLYGSLDYGDGQGDNAGATSFGLWHIDGRHKPHRLFTYYKRHQTAGTYAREIVAAIRSFHWTSGVMPKLVLADPSLFIKSKIVQVRNGREEMEYAKSVADIFQEYGLTLTPANNERVNGWRVMREYFVRDDQGVPNSFYWDGYNSEYEGYIPQLLSNKLRPDDLEKGGEDHIADEARYGLVHFMGLKSANAVAEKKVNSYRNIRIEIDRHAQKMGVAPAGWN